MTSVAMAGYTLLSQRTRHLAYFENFYRVQSANPATSWSVFEQMMEVSMIYTHSVIIARNWASRDSLTCPTLHHKMAWLREKTACCRIWQGPCYQLSLSQPYWAEAIHTTNYLLNYMLSKAVNQVTSYELWWNRKPHITHLWVFGSVAYLHVHKQK